jgi:molybdopterin adenylyltransferase
LSIPSGLFLEKYLVMVSVAPCVIHPIWLDTAICGKINAVCLQGILMIITVGILTISDKGWRGERADESGKAIRELISRLDSRVERYEIVPDEMDIISRKLKEWADEGTIDVIITTGGTGLSQRDVTPEATLAILDKVVPGIAEAMRARTLEKTPMAMLSRATAGLRKKCLIINLPGSPKAVRECLEVALPAITHAVEIIKGVVTEHAIKS